MFSEKGRTLRVVDNFKFRFHKRLGEDMERWACTTKSCSAYMKIGPDGSVIFQKLEHNHPAVADRILTRQSVSNSVKRKAVENMNERPKKMICAEMTAEASNILKEWDMDLMRRTVHRARASERPPLPKTLEDLHAALDSMNVLNKRKESFLLVNDAASNIVIFGTEANLAFMAQCDSILMDGTFATAPRLFKQLFIIHGKKKNTYVALIYCLLPAKKTDTYKTALEHFAAKMLSSYSPNAVHVDFEEAIQEAVMEIWPHTSIKGCRFHPGQSWFRQMQSRGLATAYRGKDEIGSFLRMFFGLPFLKLEDVEDCFQNDFKPKAPKDNVAIKNFITYVHDWYIAPGSRFPPAVWASYTLNIQNYKCL